MANEVVTRAGTDVENTWLWSLGQHHKVVFTTGHLFWQDGIQTKYKKKDLSNHRLGHSHQSHPARAEESRRGEEEPKLFESNNFTFLAT